MRKIHERALALLMAFIMVLSNVTGIVQTAHASELEETAPVVIETEAPAEEIETPVENTEAPVEETEEPVAETTEAAETEAAEETAAEEAVAETTEMNETEELPAEETEELIIDEIVDEVLSHSGVQFFGHCQSLLLDGFDRGRTACVLPEQPV